VIDVTDPAFGAAQDRSDSVRTVPGVVAQSAGMVFFLTSEGIRLN
jgi:hypothetical protein